MRTTVDEATQFEQLCDDRGVRERLIRHCSARDIAMDRLLARATPRTPAP